MVTRLESAAATCKALTQAASFLLDSGGPDAVTLREVGALAGVSRSAPYRHFADKESLLTTIATDAWSAVGDVLEVQRERSDLTPKQSLRLALVSLVDTGRSRPHLYRLMFTTPQSDPTAAVRAAARAQDLFLGIVSDVLGSGHDARKYAGLLMTSAHGITGMEISGHLVWDKWHATAEDLVDLLIDRLPRGA